MRLYTFAAWRLCPLGRLFTAVALVTVLLAPAFVAPRPLAAQSAAPTYITLYVDGKYYPSGADSIDWPVGKNLDLKATWNGGPLDGTGWWVWMSDGGSDQPLWKRCDGGAACEFTDLKKSPIHGRIYLAELHDCRGNWWQSNIVYVNWVDKTSGPGARSSPSSPAAPELAPVSSAARPAGGTDCPPPGTQSQPHPPVGTQAQSPVQPSANPCADQNDAYEELRTQAMASQLSLELLRDYRTQLDSAYETTRESAFADAAVDVASLGAGWPLGKAVEDAIRGKIEQTLKEKLIKAGFKSVEKRLLKDPTVAGVLDQFGSGNVLRDLAKETAKNDFTVALGEEAGQSIVGMLDLVNLGANLYEGISQLEALRGMTRDVDNYLVVLNTRHSEQVDMLDNANHARQLCQDRVDKQLPPDNNNAFWQRVTDYLQASQPSTAAVPDDTSPSGLTLPTLNVGNPLDASCPAAGPGDMQVAAPCIGGFNGGLTSAPILTECFDSHQADPDPNIAVGPVVDNALLPPGWALITDVSGIPTLIQTPPDTHLSNSVPITPQRVQAARAKLAQDIQAMENDLDSYCARYQADWERRFTADPPLPETEGWQSRIHDLATVLQAAKQLRADIDFRLGNSQP